MKDVHFRLGEAEGWGRPDRKVRGGASGTHGRMVSATTVTVARATEEHS